MNLQDAAISFANFIVPCLYEIDILMSLNFKVVFDLLRYCCSIDSCFKIGGEMIKVVL